MTKQQAKLEEIRKAAQKLSNEKKHKKAIADYSAKSGIDGYNISLGGPISTW